VSKVKVFAVAGFSEASSPQRSRPSRRLEAEAKAIGHIWRESQAPLAEEEIIYKKKAKTIPISSLC
jgi:hypothetical protein